MKIYNFLAFDIGATSGRAVLATFRNAKFETREISRFPNELLDMNGKLYWDVYAIFKSLKEALRICAGEGIRPDSIGIDTWGVDFGYIGPDGTLLSLPRAYRDSYTDGMPEEFFKTIPRREVYESTGIQVMNFNSLYQLFAAGKENFSPLDAASRILFIPDLLSYMLTGRQVTEYTDASTSQILDARTRKPDARLLRAAGVGESLLGEIVMPGKVVGPLLDSIAEETGIGPVPVVAVAGHDTASAVAAVPAMSGNFAYLSSGTWSLMGIEVPQPIITDESYAVNFTNEGGVDGTIRFLKNIAGMWLLEQCRKEWARQGREYDYRRIVEMAGEELPFRSLVNPDAPDFANPPSMSEAIRKYCLRTGQPAPESDGQFIRCIFDSLPLRYREVIDILRRVAPFTIDVLHVIGGGSKNALLNQLTANATGVKVIAGPAEATAIGNALIQARSAGLASSLGQMREMIARSVETEVFNPEDTGKWDEVYEKYREITASA